MADREAASGEVRQDQVQNAVAFLTHKKVLGSSMEDRRKFLVKKGLTDAGLCSPAFPSRRSVCVASDALAVTACPSEL